MAQDVPSKRELASVLARRSTGDRGPPGELGAREFLVRTAKNSQEILERRGVAGSARAASAL